MIGVAFHSPSLVGLMVDRERFVAVVVPAHFDSEVQEELETLFAKKTPTGTRRLLLVEKAETLSKVAAHFPEAKARIVVFDVVENLKDVTELVIDVQETDSVRKLVAIKPTALNPALVRLKPTAFESLRHDFKVEETKLATRDGRLVVILKGSKPTFQKNAIQYLLGMSSFVAVKRSGRQDKSRVVKVQEYAESDQGTNLMHAFMDMSLYSTEDKEAAVFFGADLEDLRLCASVVEPDSDLSFNFEVPDKLKLARE